ncbi:C40 family peptidase [Pseudodesulfovibrio sp.]|uniref:C40 family peptidase n=1 Tax=Pseudodesulfovibrio sp. TaxID=2035812 RepID=UPI00260589FD|nr:C40 family peptidase [Pseudodesulfovibrio sp.]MDD3313270.1 C40 family peptidase [Pseudodesulfovibrio sp.]
MPGSPTACRPRSRTTGPGRAPGLPLLASLLLAALLAGGCAAKSPAPAQPGLTPGAPIHRAATTKAAAVIRTARSLIGVRYKWGGASPDQGFDCSGLAWYVFNRNGVDLPRISWRQFGAGAPVTRDDLRPGDLIFHQVEDKKKGLHVGIVTDRGTFIHAPSSGKRVMESPLDNPYWDGHYLGARRVL